MADLPHIRIRHLRVFRPRKSIFEMYDDAQLIKRYRFDRAGIVFIINLVRQALQSPVQRQESPKEAAGRYL